MTKKEIKILAQESYSGRNLDEKKVMEFSSYMDRKTVKRYLRAVKTIEKQKNVIIATASIKSYNTNKELFEELFENKNIIPEEDPSLLLGLRITDNDMIYEKSLDSSFENILTDIKKNYN